MTFIPSVLSIVDNNNSINNSSYGDSSYQGDPTVTSGYNYLILTLNCNVSSDSNGIQIYMYNDGETPSIYYSDTYYASTNYTRNFKIVKKNYKVYFTSSSTITSINLTSRLETCELNDSINNSISTFDYSKEFMYDAFGKLRVSNPFTILDIKLSGFNTGATTFVNDNLQLCSDTSGSYTVSNQEGYLKISGTNSGHYISQSRNFCVYQPGKSFLILLSGVLAPIDSSGNYVSNFEGRIGYYSNSDNVNTTTPYNGVYFSYDANVCSINLVNKGIIATYAQSIWNLDTMNGNGPSKQNLDFTKAQLFVIDVEWLGVGRLRFGFYIYGQIHYCHQILNINSLLAPYMSSMLLPIRYELIGTGTGTASISQICSTIISEGGYIPFGRTFTAVTTTPKTINSETPVLAIRGGGSNYKHQNIIPTQVDLVNITNNDLILGRLRLYRDTSTNNAGVADASWNAIDASYSVTQYYNGTFTGFSQTGSIVLRQIIFSGKATNSVNDLSNLFTNQTAQLTSNVRSVADILVITCQNISAGPGNVDIYAALDISEIY